MRFAKCCALFVVATLAAGCQTALKSKLWAPGATAKESLGKGQAYFLPKTVFVVDLSVKETGAAKAACAATAAKQAATACKKTHPASPVERAACVAELQPVLKSNCEKAIPANVGPWAVKLKLEARFVPDPERMYLMSYRDNFLSDDDLTVEFDKEGFLKTVKGKTEDKTGDVIEKLAAIAINVAKAMHGIPSEGKRILTPPGGCDLASAKGDRTWLRAYDSGEWNVDTTNPRRRTIDLTVPGAPGCKVTLSSELLAGVQKHAAPPESTGILVAVPRAHSVAADFKLGTRSLAQARLYPALPDDGPVVSIAVDRMPFSTVNHEIEIAKGMLRKLRIHRPSPIANFLDVPLRILERIVSLPTELLQLKYDGPQAALRGEKDLLATQLQIEQLQQQLGELRARGDEPGE